MRRRRSSGARYQLSLKDLAAPVGPIDRKSLVSLFQRTGPPVGVLVQVKAGGLVRSRTLQLFESFGC